MSKPVSTKRKSHVNGVKVYTRHQAEKAMSEGADPSLFAGHTNYHVKRKVLLLSLKNGSATLPADEKERNDLLAKLHIKPQVVGIAPMVETPSEENVSA